MTYFSFFSRFQKRLSAFSIATWTRRWSGPGRSPTCVGFDTFQCRADVDCSMMFADVASLLDHCRYVMN